MLEDLQKAHKEFVAQVEKTQKTIDGFVKYMKDITNTDFFKVEDKVDKECSTCGTQQCSQPTPDGQDICVDCGGNEDLIDIRLFDEPEYDAQFNSNI